MIISRHLILLLVFLAAVSSLPAKFGLADEIKQSNNNEQPLHVEADTAEFDDKTGISVYRGKVRVTQGNMLLTGDHVTVVAPHRRLEKIISRGEPSTFHQTTSDGEPLDAQAEYMEYNAKIKKITLLKKASLHQGKNSFSSERIEYQILTKVVDAGDPKGGDRVQMTISPNTIDLNQ